MNGYPSMIVGSIINLIANIFCIVGFVGLILCVVAGLQKKEYKSKINLPLISIIVYMVLGIISVIIGHMYPGSIVFQIFRFVMIVGVILAKVFAVKEDKESK